MLSRVLSVSTTHRTLVSAISLFLLALGINLIGLDFRSLTSDECFSIYHAQMSPRLIYHHLSSGNNPPLFEWMLHYWMLLWGDSPFSVRLPSAIFSSLTTALIYLLGRQFSPSKANSLGTIAAILFLSSNYTTFLAHEARTYDLTLFLGVLTTLLFVRAIKDESKWQFFTVGLTGGLLCLSHFFGLWILIALGLYWLVKPSGKHSFWTPIGWAILGFSMSFGWYLPNVWHRFVDSASQGTWVNPAPWDAPYHTLWKYLNTPIATILGIALLLWLSVRAFIQKQPTDNRPSFTLITWFFALPFFGQWLLSLNHPWSIPMFTERYASISLPFLCLILSMGLIRLGDSFGPRTFKISAVVFMVTVLIGKNFTPPNFAAARESLKLVEARTKDTSRTTQSNFLHPIAEQTPLIIEPYHAAFQVLYYKDHKRFTEYHPTNIYEHLASQLSHSNVWILKSKNSFDSLGLSHSTKIAYLHFGSEKSVHTKTIESQLENMTQLGGRQHVETIQIPKTLLGTWEIESEAEFWLIEKN